MYYHPMEVHHKGLVMNPTAFRLDQEYQLLKTAKIPFSIFFNYFKLTEKLMLLCQVTSSHNVTDRTS